jgi:hypothetical protein
MESQLWLPKSLPDESNEEEQTKQSATKYVLPMTIKISRPKSIRQPVHPARALVSVLSAMQNEYQDTYLAPLQKDAEKIILNPTDIPIDETKLNKYIEKPGLIKEKIFLIRIVMISNNPLNKYKESMTFRKYLAKENIVLDYNDLESIDPISYLDTKPYIYITNGSQEYYREMLPNFN